MHREKWLEGSRTERVEAAAQPEEINTRQVPKEAGAAPLLRPSSFSEAAETKARYHRQLGLQIKVARIFNTYGPRMHPNDGRVVSNFIVHALEDRPITIYGDGSQTRSFCYVDDLIDGLVRLMNSPAEVTGPINLGNPDEYTIRELAQLIVEKTGSDVAIEKHELPTDDPKQRQPDISAARALHGWDPSVPVSEGLDRTIAYFRAIGCSRPGEI